MRHLTETRSSGILGGAWLWNRKSPESHEIETGLHHHTVENLSDTSAVNGSIFLKQGRMRQRKERDGLRLSSVVPKIQWTSNPTTHTAVGLWESFTFLSHRSVLNPLSRTC